MKKLLLIATVLFLLAGCSSKQAYYEPDSGYIANEDYYEGTVRPSNNYNKGDYGTGNDVSITEVEQKIIKNSYMEIETDHYDETMSQIMSAISACNGYIQSSSTRKYNYTVDRRVTEMVIRIPADKGDSFLTDTKQTGNVVSESVSTQDVTTSYYDTQARIDALKAQEETLLSFYAKAETIQDLMDIEARISDVRYQIESYQTTMNNYELLTKYDTFNITIEETTVYTVTDTGFGARIINAFKGMTNNFVTGLQDTVIGLIYAIPTIVIIAVMITVAVKIARKSSIRLPKLKKSKKEETVE